MCRGAKVAFIGTLEVQKSYYFVMQISRLMILLGGKTMEKFSFWGNAPASMCLGESLADCLHFVQISNLGFRMRIRCLTCSKRSETATFESEIQTK